MSNEAALTLRPSAFDSLRPALQQLASSAGVVVLALLFGGALIAAWGVNPVAAYGALFSGAFGNFNSIAETLLRSIPLMCTGLAVAFAFRAGTFNIGAEGQLLFGGMAAAVVGLSLTPVAPTAVLIPAMMASAVVAGALWSLLPGVLKLRFGASELITTIMLNYVAVHFISFLLLGPFQESAGFLAQTDRLDRATTLPQLIERTRLHVGLLVVLAVVVIAQFALWHTTWGYRIRVAGLSNRVALNSGMNVTTLTLSVFLVSGALAGLAGYMEVVGVQRRMVEDLSPGFGYTGIIVALLGNTSPIGVMLAAVLFAALQVGATTMETAQGVPSTIATIIQGLVVLLVIGRGALNFLVRARSTPR
jgi:simple sugar transport system permease protein